MSEGGLLVESWSLLQLSSESDLSVLGISSLKNNRISHFSTLKQIFRDETHFGMQKFIETKNLGDEFLKKTGVLGPVFLHR